MEKLWEDHRGWKLGDETAYWIVLPLIGLHALIVALDGSNPFYTQNRVGRNGRVSASGNAPIYQLFCRSAKALGGTPGPLPPRVSP